LDGKTKLNELYIAKHNIIALDEKNVEIFDEGLNDIQSWGEQGIAVKLINIGIVEELATIIFFDDVQKHPPRYYVEELKSHVILKYIRTKADMDDITNLGEPTDLSDRQLLHSTRSRTPFCLKNLLFLPHLHARKTCRKIH
jgi:hypothetical protein